jgi:hypothetical protein
VEDRPDLLAWCARAADLLGPQAGSHAALGELLSLVFAYEASAVLQEAGNQDVLARSGAREVIRELANRILDGGDVDSERSRIGAARCFIRFVWRLRGGQERAISTG